jgi:hypothetical protein
METTLIIDESQEQPQYFTPTVNLRFRQDFTQKVLQQMWQGSQGAQEWRDVPTDFSG